MLLGFALRPAWSLVMSREKLVDLLLHEAEESEASPAELELQRDLGLSLEELKAKRASQ